MSQLIISHSYDGGWHRKYFEAKPKRYATLSVPDNLRGKDRIIGTTVDRRSIWRSKVDAITRNAEYDIIIKEQGE